MRNLRVPSLKVGLQTQPVIGNNTSESVLEGTRVRTQAGSFWTANALPSSFLLTTMNNPPSIHNSLASPRQCLEGTVLRVHSCPSEYLM